MFNKRHLNSKSNLIKKRKKKSNEISFIKKI